MSGDDVGGHEKSLAERLVVWPPVEPSEIDPTLFLSQNESLN